MLSGMSSPFIPKVCFLSLVNQDGVNRYDGHSFLVFRQSRLSLEDAENRHVQGFVEDEAGLIWATTSRGLYQFDSKKVHRVRCRRFQRGDLGR